MSVIVAKNAGFCYGVKRALDIANEELRRVDSGGVANTYSLGKLIHNDEVISRLRQLGLVEVSDISEVPSYGTVIIRAHGESEAIFKRLDESGLRYRDATCPHVQKIHRIVREQSANGYKIVIAGDADHPEVIGIRGWCDGASVVLPDNTIEENEIFEQLKSGGIGNEDKICLVAQTTIDRDNWEKIKKVLNNTCKCIAIFDTICSTTMLRQQEAKELAAQVDCLFVIGSKKSSNTKKLENICKRVCQNTHIIEKAADMPKIPYNQYRIGITAGASTPEWVIKEVIQMSEETNVETAELNFAEELEKTVVTLKSGDIVKGTVISITPNEVYVNLGVKADGSIPVSELTDNPILSPEEVVSVGDEIEVFVVRVNDIEGTITLSKKKLDLLAGWKKLEEAFETQEILTGKVVEILRGGLIVSSNNVRVFVPASQASDRYLQDLGILLNEEVSFRIIDINPKRRKLVGSIKSVAGEVKKRKMEEFWGTAEVGKKYTGTVKSLTQFGAFVDIGGVDGLVHISELSWSRVKHPSEVVKEGDKLNVFILALDKEKNKVSLGYRLPEDSPWNAAKNNIHLNDVIKAKIVRLVPFGAFAEIMPHIDGLIHISQISDQRIAKPSDVLSVGQEVDAKVIELDFENKKIALSIKAVTSGDSDAAPTEE